MKNEILKRDIDAYCKEIYERYHVIKEIDFNKDIDVEKSDRYVVDDKYRKLEFLYRSIRNIEMEDYRTNIFVA